MRYAIFIICISLLAMSIPAEATAPDHGDHVACALADDGCHEEAVNEHGQCCSTCIIWINHRQLSLGIFPTKSFKACKNAIGTAQAPSPPARPPQFSV